MQRFPKRVTTNDEKDYASIYEDNFIRNNDPAALGQQAFARQLSQGIQRGLREEPKPETPVVAPTKPAVGPRLEEMQGQGAGAQVPPVVPGLYGAGGQQQATAMQQAVIEQDALVAQEARVPSAAQLAGYRTADVPSPVPQEEPVREEEPTDSATQVFETGLADEEKKLQERLDAETNFIQQQFNQKYNEFLQKATREAESRGSLAAQGFGGGIGQQIEDFLSAQEIEQLGQLYRERDAALQDVKLQMADIPALARQNYIQNLQLENASLEARTAFSQNLSQLVLSGSMSLQEAEAISQQYGLQSVQSVFESAIQAQIAAGTMDKTAAKAELDRLGLNSDFLEKEGQTFGSFALSEEASKLEGFITDALKDASGGNFGQKLTTAFGAAGVGFAVSGGNPIGALIGLAVGTVTAITQDVNVTDLGKVTPSLFQSDLMVNEGEDIINGNFEEMSIVRGVGQDNEYGQMANIFQVTIDGATYQMEGADLMVLAAALKRNNYPESDKYKQLFDIAAQVKESAKVLTAGRLFDAVTGQRYTTVVQLYNAAFK